MIYWASCELTGEQVRPILLHTIVFDVCLICVCNLFDEMAAWNQVLNFEMIFGGFARLVLVRLQMLGFWKLSLFEWFLKKWDLPIWNRFNFKLSFKPTQFSKPKHPQNPQDMPSTPTKNLFKIQNLSSCGHFIKQVADSNQQNQKHYVEQCFGQPCPLSGYN